MPTLNFIVNGNPVSVEVKPNEFLAEVLRYKLGLTGTKIGCNEAECGICTVILDGQPVGHGDDWRNFYAIPLKLTPGKTHVLAFKVVNKGGPGALVAEAR